MTEQAWMDDPQARTNLGFVEVAQPIACTLPTAEMPDRMAAWRAVMDVALLREATAEGVRLSLPRDPELVAQVAELAAREQECCTFFTFTITLTAPSQFLLDVAAPGDARALVQDLFTAPQAGLS